MERNEIQVSLEVIDPDRAPLHSGYVAAGCGFP
jgi:hypothetical protein